jgi:hypothetical protein
MKLISAKIMENIHSVRATKFANIRFPSIFSKIGAEFMHPLAAVYTSNPFCPDVSEVCTPLQHS